MIKPLLFMAETSSNRASSHYASGESLAQSSAADHFTRMKVSDETSETNVIGDEKTINTHLLLPEKLSLVGDFAAVGVWERINKKNVFVLFSSTRDSNKVFERVLRDNSCIL